MPALRGMAPTRRRIADAIEGAAGVVGAHDVRQQREGAVVELHAHALERAEGLGDLEQLEDHRLVVAQHLTAGDAEQQGVADLAGSPGDGDAYGILHGGRPYDAAPPGSQTMSLKPFRG